MTNFPTLLSTNATRFVLWSGASKCVEFGLRRAQGPNGAIVASKYSYMGGFIGTSNVYASFLTGCPCLGTVAHSFIMSYEKEDDCKDSRMLDGKDLLLEAMRYRTELGWTSTNMGELYAYVSFATSYPKAFSALVDSYSTMNSGIKNYILVALVLKDLGYDSTGIRLDSGDLSQLSKDCRKIMTETSNKYGYDFSKHMIVASNDINETSLKALKDNGHEIDVFGIGTNLVTCQAQPALGMVYKVVEFQGTPRMKFSEEVEKITIPGSKSVVRIYDEADKPQFDLLCLQSEVEQILKNENELKYFLKKRLDSESSTLKPHAIK